MEKHFLSQTHGGAFPLPKAWCKYHTPLIYALSSILPLIPGGLLLIALHQRPDRRVYNFEEIEGWFLILQGIISYKSDVADLAQNSSSHPIERLYTTSLCLFFAIKIILCSFLRIYSTTVLFVCLVTFAFGIFAFFQASREELLKRNETSFREWTRWIVVWHVSVPAGLCVAGWMYFAT